MKTVAWCKSKTDINLCVTAKAAADPKYVPIFTALTAYNADVANKDKKLKKCTCDGSKTDDKLKSDPCAIKDCTACTCSNFVVPGDAVANLTNMNYPDSYCGAGTGDSVIGNGAKPTAVMYKLVSQRGENVLCLGA